MGCKRRMDTLVTVKRHTPWEGLFETEKGPDPEGSYYHGARHCEQKPAQVIQLQMLS